MKNADYWDVFFEYNEKFYKTLPSKGVNFPLPADGRAHEERLKT